MLCGVVFSIFLLFRCWLEEEQKKTKFYAKFMDSKGLITDELDFGARQIEICGGQIE
jgi:hypothetical protein